MKSILTINSGSSSIKACLFDANGSRRDFRYEHLREHAPAFDQLMQDLHGQKPDIVGHRFVHGGEIVDAARIVDKAERTRLEGIIPLAPLHLPGNLMGLDLCQARFDVPQVACFDTAFHATLPELAKRLPIPQELHLRRFGFHGLNYAHVASVLPDFLGNAARGKIIVAHLGSGASLCAMENLQSVDTSMGYTPAGGVPMGTRSGDLDPGIMLELAERHDPRTLRQLVFKQMGLLALSANESSDMRELLDSRTASAQFAIDFFCHQVTGAIGNFAAKAGGIDALVFTGGIGENSAEIRNRICAPLGFMGLTIDPGKNQTNDTFISKADNKPILVIDADEEQTIRALCVEYATQSLFK